MLDEDVWIVPKSILNALSLPANVQKSAFVIEYFIFICVFSI